MLLKTRELQFFDTFTDERENVTVVSLHCFDARFSHERDSRMIASMCDMSLHVVDTCWVLSLVAAEENMY